MNQPEISQPVFLCGMMGAGKSTIGKLLAKKLDKPFLDLDRFIEEDTGMSIPEIFAEKGEKEFRNIERQLLKQLSQSTQGVVALGGGSLQNQHLTNHIKKNGLLVFLDVPVTELVNRLRSSENRPMLSGSDTKTKITTLLEDRLPFYQQAHIIMKTGNLIEEEVVKKLFKKLQMYER